MKDIGNIHHKKIEISSIMDMDFNLREMRRALERRKCSAPGQDQVCYVMFRQLPEEAVEIVFHLFYKIWKEGRLPVKLKSALILPFAKTGKDSANPITRPTALTAHLCKWMGKKYRFFFFFYRKVICSTNVKVDLGKIS